MVRKGPESPCYTASMAILEKAPTDTAGRSNEEWLRALTGAPEDQEAAIADLQARLRRGLVWYLTRERSDLDNRPLAELERMAEDFTQDALLRILKRLDSFRGESRFTTWATRIALRVAISDLRRARYRDFRLDDLTVEGELLPRHDPASAGDDPAPSPEGAAERQDVQERVLRALQDSLTPRQRQALEAVVLQNVPLEIVAQQMGSNRNALYKLLHDARRKLRARLEEQGLDVAYVLELFA
ncbi:MAG: RNA polymerase sigma factor [Anaerolineaceae bacterium]|nr:RNA polymerase sigma factor [Anaerolineaceae bacterium]